MLTGTLQSLERLRSSASPELVAISAHPRLDAQRVLRVYKELGITGIAELRPALESGAIERCFGLPMAQHIRQGLVETSTILLYHAHCLRKTVEDFLLHRCKVARAEAVGDY